MALLNEVFDLRCSRSSTKDLADDDDVDFLNNEDANVCDFCLLPQLLHNASHFFHEEFGKRLNKVMALTAFGDPLYCEAIVTMHSYDIVLDIFIVNRTAGRLHHHVLRNAFDVSPQIPCLTSALISPLSATCAWWSVCSRFLCLLTKAPRFVRASRFPPRRQASFTVPSPTTWPPRGAAAWPPLICERFQSTLPTFTWTSWSTLFNVDAFLSLTARSYIKPAQCSDAEFRKMWSEFEWENKVQ